MVFFLENFSLLQLIVFYNFLLVRWFSKGIQPKITCHTLLYMTLLDALSRNAVCSENVLQFSFLVIYIAFLVVLLVISVSEKKTYVLAICIAMFTYFEIIGKLDIHSVSLAFFSCVWYNKLGVIVTKKIIVHYFFRYENYLFSNVLFAMSTIFYFSITILYKIALWETSIKYRIFKKIVFSVAIWISIYYLKSIILFLVINILLTVFLVINSVFLFALQTNYVIPVFYDQLQREKYSSIYERLYVLSCFEADPIAKKMIEKNSFIFCVFEENIPKVLKPMFDNFFFQNLETKEYKVFVEFFEYLRTRKDYNNLSHDVELLKLEKTVSDLTEEEVKVSNTYKFLKELEFTKEKLLMYHRKESNIVDCYTDNSSLLLVMKTPIWYININFPLIQLFF